MRSGTRRYPPCLLLALCGSLLFGRCALSALPATAQSRPAAPVARDRIRADLQEILSSQEFRPNQAPANEQMRGYLKWLRDKWDAFWKWFNSLFSLTGIRAGGEPLMWIFVTAFLGASGWLLYRYLRERRTRQRERQARARFTLEAEEWGDSPLPTAAEWLREAEEAERSGDYRRAFRGVFLALWMRLDQAEVLEFDRTRTNGMHLDRLRRDGYKTLLALMRPQVLAFDERWYGERETDAQDYRAIREQYTQLEETLAALRRDAESSPLHAPPATEGAAS